jgi:hypothetical protein
VKFWLFLAGLVLASPIWPEETAMTSRTLAPFAFAALALSALAAAGCSGTDSTTSTAGMGQVKVEMGATSAGTLAAATTGEAPATLASLEVTVSSLRARMADGTWQEIDGSYPQTVDVLALAAAGEVAIGSGLLPAGTYTALEVVIAGATATLSDDTQITVDFPPPGRAVILPVTFEVVEGEQAFVDIRLDLDLSFKFDGSGFEFEPEFEIEVDDHDD